jgi:hypothetical protein
MIDRFLHVLDDQVHGRTCFRERCFNRLRYTNHVTMAIQSQARLHHDGVFHQAHVQAAHDSIPAE